MTSSTRLPAEFTSLYRLFLRAIGASVMNKAYPTKRLRRIWRPSFDSAARVIHRLQGTSLDANERLTLQQWYSAWEARTDKTLTLLSISARSRGLAHRLTCNLGRLASSYDDTIMHGHPDDADNLPWKPDLSSDLYAPRDNSPPGYPLRGRNEDRDFRRKIGTEVWSAFGEVIRMAEGRDGVSLGRIASKR
ncbi:hypothetical protein DAEQUDRAFT_743803 [Daedalea quercina L-15889]|uniref:Uncharacterized protein n=1 Tax=Daedalea quercina L-15889 TaxID=1314783 RepID=A0A165SSN2_9APHY|nr:hypothetical protein DAEQUDRAFT_743803 [Daedalea quercina L-15889]